MAHNSFFNKTYTNPAANYVSYLQFQRNDEDLLHEGGATMTRAQARRLNLEPESSSEAKRQRLNDELNESEQSGEDNVANLGSEVEEPQSHQDEEEHVANNPDQTLEEDDVQAADNQESLPEHPNNEDHLVTSTVTYDKDTMIVENNLVQCHIYRAFHRHQRIFQSEDHLYKMNLKPKTNEPILWSSIEKLLEDAFATIISNLQIKYASDSDALLYFAIDQNSLVNGLRSSVHVLKENSTRGMVQNVMSTFNSFLNSNQNIQLNSTFEVYFKVVSGIHVNSAGHRRKAIPLRTTVGHRGGHGNCFIRGGLLDVPVGYSENPTLFQDQCLLLCLVFQFLKLTQPTVKRHLDAFLKKKESRLKVIASEMLEAYVEEFCHRAQISRQGPHDLHTTAKLFSEIYNCQVTCITSLDGIRPQFVMFPSTFNFELQRIYLYVKNDHVLLIDNLHTFWRHQKRKICFGCKNVYGYWKNDPYHHKCPHLTKCTMCCAVLQTNQTIFIPNESFLFCDASMATHSDSINCQHCENKFKTLTCYSNHLKQCENGRIPTKCPICSVMVPQSHRLVHSCNDELKFCKICFCVTTLEHECLIKKQTETKQWPIVGTLVMSFKNTSSSDCQMCYEAKIKYAAELNIPYQDFCREKTYLSVTCDNHSWNPSDPSRTNAILIWKERSRFSFERLSFVDDVLQETLDVQNSADAYLKHRLHTYCSNPKPYISLPNSKTKSKLISQSLEAVKTAHFESAEKKFFQYIVRGNLQNCTILLNSDQAMHKLLEIFISFEVLPYISQKGKQIFCLELSQFSVKFLNFSHYAPGGLNLWLKQYNVTNELVYFPECLNTDQNLASSEKCEINFDDFICFGDSVADIDEKKLFYQKLLQPLDLKKYLLDVLDWQSDSFFRVVMEFLRQTFLLQKKLSSLFQKDTNCPIHPFADKIVSCSSLIHSLCQYYCLNDYNISTVHKPYGNNPAQISEGEYEFTSFLAHENPTLNIRTAFNHPRGQQIFGKLTADAYSNVNKCIYAYFGCWYHSHGPNECLSKQAKSRADNDKNPILAQRRRESDIKLLEDTIKNFPTQVHKYEITWECQWSLFKKNNPSKLNQFWENTGLPKKRQLTRLVPRAAVRGGFLETYKLKSFADDESKISWIDANSLYSFIAMQCPLPLGSYKILTFSDLKDQCILDSEDGMFYYNGASMECDIAMVEILCPKNLKKPFLSYRVRDEFVFLANCKKCATLKLNQPCKHSDANRAFTSTWTVVELAYAVHNLGYQILNWLEVHHYENSGLLLEKFIKTLASEKLKCSGILSDCKSQTQKVNLCQEVNKAMGFIDSELLLIPSNCSDNAILKNYLKTCLNSLYGRFALNSNHTKREFCRSFHEIEKFTSNPNCNVLDFITINDNVVELVVENLNNKGFADRKSNPLFTALINARGRIFIYELAKQLEHLGCDILSIDTDSICFNHTKDLADLPIKFSPAFGHFKHCLDDHQKIKAFYSLGVRSYLILYEDENGCEKYLTKIKGLSLGSHNVMDKIDPKLFQSFIDSNFKQEVESIYIPQCRQRLNKQTKTFKQIMSTHEFTNEIHCKRYIVPEDETFVTYSYGYKE